MTQYMQFPTEDGGAILVEVDVEEEKAEGLVKAGRASDGTQANGCSLKPSISADGRYVAFTSTATNLVADDRNHVQDTFVHDRKTGQTTRIGPQPSGYR